jgi:translocation and assembly module TamB
LSDPGTSKAPLLKPHHIALGVVVAVCWLLLGIWLVVRYGPMTPVGREFVARRLEGLPVGRLGRLHVERLSGDLWTAFGVGKLTITDPKGVWLEADNVRVTWSPAELFGRRVEIEDAEIGQLHLYRQPVLAAPSPLSPAPVAVTLNHIELRLESDAAFSGGARGLFDLAGALDAERNGGLAGAIDAKSLLHPGDGVTARFDYGVRKRLAVDAKAQEARGGAIAGALGLAPNQAFLLEAHAGGAKDQGWLHVRAASGGAVIAEADGDWTKAGGAVRGRMSLAASHWTSGLMHALGPEVSFTGQGRPGAGGLYDVAFAGRSDNAALTLAGPADTARFEAPKGLKGELDIKDLTRMVSSPAMGAGKLVGTITHTGRDWRLAGDAQVSRITTGDYALAGAGGAFDLAYVARVWRLKLDAAGVGGQGKGTLAALIGAKPHASFDGQRLADGRLLVQSLTIDGAGLKVQAAGARSLFGGLTFKGTLQASNLAMIRPGAAGLVQANWSAAQSGAQKPWTLTFDASGAKFSSGIADLDRLLGPTPKLHAETAFDAGAVLISKADLSGAAGDASATGPIGKDGALKLAVKWSAHAPLDLGPAQISGASSGAGTVTGSLSAPQADIAGDFEHIDAPPLALKGAHMALTLAVKDGAATGGFGLTATSDDGPAHAKAGFRFAGGDLSLDGIDAAAGGATAAGSLALHDGALSTADLNLVAGPGAFLTQGRMTAALKIAGPGPTANLSLAADDAVMKGSNVLVEKARVTANGPLSRAPYKISADLAVGRTPVHLQGSGVAGQAAHGYAVTFEGAGKVQDAEFHTLAPIEVDSDAGALSAKADVSVGGGRAVFTTLENSDGLTTKGTLSGVDLALIDPDLAGKADADFSAEGRGAALAGTLNAQLTGARGRDAPAKLAMDGTVHATLAGDRLSLEASAQVAGGNLATFNAVLPADASAAPFHFALARDRQMSGQFTADGEVAPIWNLFFSGEQSLGGRVTARGEIAGTVAAPSISGHASVTNGQFEDAASGVRLRNVAAQVDVSPDAVVVQSFTGTDLKSGTLSGQGQVNLVKGGASSFTLTAKSFQLLDNETASAIASGTVTLSRDASGKANLSGQLHIDRADISAEMSRSPPGVVRMDVVERNRPVDLDTGLQAEPERRAPPLDLNIALHAPGKVFVKGLGLNAEMSLEAQVTGDLGQPVLQGTARVIRGEYDFAGQRFEIDSRSRVALASTPENIRLDLSATRNDPSLTAIVQIKGSAAKPVITLSSTPSLPSDEILAQVIFGQSASQLSAVQAAQLAAAVATLASGGGFDVMGGLSKFAKLDRIALGGGDAATGGVTVSGGKYIGSRLYVELTGGGRTGGSAQVEVRATHDLSIISQLGGAPGAKIAVQWRRDYGAAKPKKPAAAAK